MADHLNDDTITRYQERKLNAAELKALDRHLASCEVCAEKMIDSKGKRDAAMTLISILGNHSMHLTYEQLKEYVESGEPLTTYREAGPESMGRSAIADHLADCSRCRGDLQNLISLQKTLPDEIYSMNMLAAELTQAAPTATRMRTPAKQKWVWIGGLALAGSALAAVVLWFNITLSARNHVVTLGLVQQERQKAAIEKKLAVALHERDAALHERDVARQERDKAKHITELTQTQKTKLQQELAQVKSTVDRHRAVSTHGLWPLISNTTGFNNTADGNRAVSTHGLWQEMSPGNLVKKATPKDTIPPDDIPGETMASSGGDHPIQREDFRPKSPDGSTVMSDHPVLEWYGDSDVTGYDLKIYRLNNGKREDIPFRQGTAGGDKVSWKVSPPLKRGDTYEWQLEGRRAVGPPVAAQGNDWPRFRVASQETAKQFVSEQIRHAIQLSSMGALDKAEAVLDDAIEANATPDLTARAKQLLTSLHEQRTKGP